MPQEWTGPAVAETVGALRRAAADFAAVHGVVRPKLDDIRACVSEAVTNAVVHAYRDGRPPGTIAMSAEITAQELVVLVTDDGIGFLPRNDSPGLGVGIPAIAGMSTSMAVSTPPGGGTRVRMSFALG